MNLKKIYIIFLTSLILLFSIYCKADNVRKLSSNTMFGKSLCYATVLETGKILTSFHCALNRDGYFSKYLYLKDEDDIMIVTRDEDEELREISKSSDIAKDIIYLNSEKQLESDIVVNCKGFSGLLYSYKGDICKASLWKSGIATLSNCTFKEGNSGMPLFTDIELKNVCAIYSTSLYYNHNSSSLGVATLLN